MKDAVSTLLAKANEIKSHASDTYATEKAKLNEKLNTALSRARELVHAAQELCAHDGERRTEDDYDYHNNVHWTKEYCAACGKYLGRY